MNDAYHQLLLEQKDDDEVPRLKKSENGRHGLRDESFPASRELKGGGKTAMKALWFGRRVPSGCTGYWELP